MEIQHFLIIEVGLIDSQMVVHFRVCRPPNPAPRPHDHLAIIRFTFLDAVHVAVISRYLLLLHYLHGMYVEDFNVAVVASKENDVVIYLGHRVDGELARELL